MLDDSTSVCARRHYKARFFLSRTGRVIARPGVILEIMRSKQTVVEADSNGAGVTVSFGTRRNISFKKKYFS